MLLDADVALLVVVCLIVCCVMIICCNCDDIMLSCFCSSSIMFVCSCNCCCCSSIRFSCSRIFSSICISFIDDEVDIEDNDRECGDGVDDLVGWALDERLGGG